MAKMRISCPNCDQKFDVDESMIGAKVECPCGNKWFVPAPPPSSFPAPELKKEQPGKIEAQSIFEKPEQTDTGTTENPPDDGCFFTMLLRIAVFAIGAVVMISGIYGLIKYGIEHSSGGGNLLKSVVGFIVILCSFVSSKHKIKRFYFICPNPNCKFEGELEYDPDAGVLSGAATMLFFRAAGVRTIIYDNPTVTCPKCGMRVPHAH